MKLPHNFIFGIAESDLQTVGSILPQQKENAQIPMWELFAKKQKIDAPLYGSFKFTNAKKDATVIGELGVKAYRTSVSMSRIIDKSGNVNKKAIKWYRDYLSAIKAKGVQIHLCLHHWEAPEEFLENGILDPGFHDYFLKHTDIVLEYLGDLVDYYIPLNELWCMSYLSYYIGIHAPGYSNLEKFFHAYFAGIKLQSDVIRHIKSKSIKNKIGIVNIFFPAYIQKENAHNRKYIKACHLANQVTNYMYSDPFYIGRLDDELVKKFKKVFPKDYEKIISNAQVGNLIDYFGVNFYNSDYIKPAKNELGYERVIPDEVLKNSLGWTVGMQPYYPDSLTDILISVSNRYKKYGVNNIVVSENGTPQYTNLESNEVPQDDFRIFYINEHLRQVQNAVKNGVPVNDYFLWTLLDNYEWQEGYKPESAFGIISVNKKTGERILKKSYYWYQQLITTFYKNK